MTAFSFNLTEIKDWVLKVLEYSVREKMTFTTDNPDVIHNSIHETNIHVITI